MTTTATLRVEQRSLRVNGVELNVATAGRGPALVLLHGWPHTWRVWQEVVPALADDHRVIAPDLRGMGGSSRAQSGYDALTLATDVLGVMDVLEEATASVVAIDAGVPPAFLLAMGHADRVARLVLMEAVLPGLPGAEAFLAAGPPWWFGFHRVPGLAETVLAGHEGEYVDHFLDTGTGGRGVDPAVRDAFVAACTGTESLRCGFEHYRSGAVNARQVADAVAAGPLTVPVLAVGADSVGDCLARQLAPVAEDLRSAVLQDCGHLVPLDRPLALLELLGPFLRGR